MIELKRPTLEDSAWIDPIFRASGFRSCEYTFTNLFTWADTYDEQAALVEGFVVVYIGTLGAYGWPAGSGDRKKVLRLLYEDSTERGVPLCLLGLTSRQIEELEAYYPEKFTFEHCRDADDYCYTVEKLATLTGKKLHAKRNHIHRFEENYPNWRVEEIGSGNLEQCLALARDWERAEAEAGLDDRNEQAGQAAFYAAARNYEALGLEGLILYGEEKPLAFTMGRAIGEEAYDVFFEKAYADVQGAYPMINREFARWVRQHHPNIVYLNREDDMGEPNLRKSKLSYHPDLMLEKHIARLRDGETL